MRAMTAAAVVVMMAACGAAEVVPDAGTKPKVAAVGDSCQFSGADCDGTRSALFCENSKLAAYPCPGGCTSGNGETLCNFAGSAPGSLCPFRMIGAGVCETDAMSVCSARTTADGGATGFGEPGTWTRRACAGGCFTGTTTLECRP